MKTKKGVKGYDCYGTLFKVIQTKSLPGLCFLYSK